MLQEVKDLQNQAVTKLVDILSKDKKKEFTFKAPTGSGKTYMMADFMNRVLSKEENSIFIVSTLSKSNLAEQNYSKFKEYTNKGTFPEINPFLINSDSSGEGSLYIPTDHNVYVLPRDLYKDKSKLKNEGTFLNFLQTMTSSLFPESKGKRIYLIKDECHIATKNLDEVQNYFYSIINFSATPKLSRGQHPDVEITNLEAEGARLIKRVESGLEMDTLQDALRKFEEIQADYNNELKVNPCFIIQISNKDKAEEELRNTIFPALREHQDLKWVYISGEDKTCDTNDAGMKKLPVSKWKDYMKENSSSISVIIFKMVISEGWDIPRACMLYQIRDSKSKQLDEQVMGRVRRNPRLLDFETLSSYAKELSCTAWIWGIIPKTSNPVRKVQLYKDFGIEGKIKVTPTKLQPSSNLFNINSYMMELEGKELNNTSIFDIYRNLNKVENEIQELCYEYADNYSKWRAFGENVDKIKKAHNEQISNYEESMSICNEISFPLSSVYVESDINLDLEDWIWCREDNITDFSFDSNAERRWAEVLKDIRRENFESVGDMVSKKFLWGKNYPFNSEIKFEYYLNGIHSSYPDFIMKDKKGIIHIFEVKGLDKSANSGINEQEYEEKVKALKDCYLECSRKTKHIFYIPLYKNQQWQISRYRNGEEENITLEQFKQSLR